MKKLIPILCMVLIVATMFGTSTYAWFSMNTTVTATGMKVRAQVGNNLFIAPDTLASTTTITTDASYKSNHVETLSALLEPVSTVDAKNFFYTLPGNVKASGDADADTYKAYSTTDFATDIGVTGAEGYKDYVFQIKAANTSTSGTATLVLKELKLTYGGTADTSKAWRVAVFCEPLSTVINSTKTTTTKNPAGVLTSLTPVIYTVSGAANFTDGKAVNATNGLDTVTYNSSSDNSKWVIAADTTAYFKFVVRLWLEGEDKTCNNDTFIQLTDDWQLDLTFALDAAGASTPTTPVTNLTAGVTSAKTDLSGASKGSNTVIVDGTTYTELSVTGYYITDATFASTSRVYKMVDSHVIDVTNTCKLPAPASAG